MALGGPLAPGLPFALTNCWDLLLLLCCCLLLPVRFGPPWCLLAFLGRSIGSTVGCLLPLYILLRFFLHTVRPFPSFLFIRVNFLICLPFLASFSLVLFLLSI